MSEKEFIDGISAKAPHERAPGFVKARVSIKLADFAKYLRELKAKEPDVEWLNFDVKESRSGNYYAERDTWKPDSNKGQSQPRQSEPAAGIDEDDQIPF